MAANGGSLGEWPWADREKCVCIPTLTAQARAGEQPTEVASGLVRDGAGDLHDVARCATVPFPPAPTLGRETAGVGRFLHVAPGHALPHES